jgi:hypothetical protein
MSDSIPNSWEPDPRQVGKNWTDMFRDPQRDGQSPGQSASRPAMEELPDEDCPTLDVTEYKPWILQRTRTRPALMLELRRYEPRSGQWLGWAMSYPSLYAVEYIGEKMLSLDFGTRQFVVEGHRLHELAHHIQQGRVLTIQEYAAAVWQHQVTQDDVAIIRRIEGGAPRQ